MKDKMRIEFLQGQLLKAAELINVNHRRLIVLEMKLAKAIEQRNEAVDDFYSNGPQYNGSTADMVSELAFYTKELEEIK